jgi:hypothetical protein
VVPPGDEVVRAVEGERRLVLLVRGSADDRIRYGILGADDGVDRERVGGAVEHMRRNRHRQPRSRHRGKGSVELAVERVPHDKVPDGHVTPLSNREAPPAAATRRRARCENARLDRQRTRACGSLIEHEVPLDGPVTHSHTLAQRLAELSQCTVPIAPPAARGEGEWRLTSVYTSGTNFESGGPLERDGLGRRPSLLAQREREAAIAELCPVKRIVGDEDTVLRRGFDSVAHRLDD